MPRKRNCLLRANLEASATAVHSPATKFKMARRLSRSFGQNLSVTESGRTLRPTSVCRGNKYSSKEIWFQERRGDPKANTKPPIKHGRRQDRPRNHSFGG